MTPKRRGRPERRRKDARRREILVFTEGEKTEESYLVPWRRECRSTVNLAVDSFHGPPLSLVRKAVARMAQGQREANRHEGRAYDEYWCVFDVDDHPQRAEAWDLAQGNGIRIAQSNPCFELWLILHLQSQEGYITRLDAQQAARQLLRCGKTLDRQAVETLQQSYEQARERAILLEKRHKNNGSPEDENPSSGMWRLIDAIQAPAARQ